MAAGLIKPAQRHDGQEMRLEANQNGGGVYGPAFKPLQTWEGLRKKSQGFKPDPGNLAVRDYRGASGKEQPTRPQSSGVQVPVPPIACHRAVSISDARGGNEPRSART